MANYIILSKILTGSLVILCLILIGSQARSEPMKGCFVNWEPYSYMNENSGPQGFSIQIYSEALRRAGLEMIFDEVPWARCKELLEDGYVDAAVDGNNEIKNTITTTLNPIPWVISLWTHDSDTAKAFKGLESLKGKSVGYVQAYTYPTKLQDDPDIESFAVVNDIEGLRMLEARRFDFFYGDMVNNRHLVERYNLKIVPIRPPLTVTFLGLTFHKSRQEEQAKYETALQSMLNDGFVDEVYEKYLGITFKQLNRASNLDLFDSLNNSLN